MHLARTTCRFSQAAVLVATLLALPLSGARAGEAPDAPDASVGVPTVDTPIVADQTVATPIISTPSIAAPIIDAGPALSDAKASNAGAESASDAGPLPEPFDAGAPALISSSPASNAPTSSAPVFSGALPELAPPPPGFTRARRSPSEPPSQQEIDDRAALQHPKCDPRWGSAFPGLGAICAGRDTEGEILLGFGAVELGTGLTAGLANGFGSTGAELPLLAFGDLLTAASIDGSLRIERARHLSYVPQESLAEDFSAPFRLDVLKQPDVYLGIIGLVGAGVLYEKYLDGPLSTQTAGQRPVLFGHTVNNAVAYPLATGIGVGLFAQVATAEEIAFRGQIQSSLTRRYGEIPGWILGSLIFGAFHASNVLFLAPNQRVDYLTHGVPFITVVGSYLGLSYMDHDYSLAPSIALHFWYDFLIEAVSFALDPKNSPLAFSYMF